VSSSVSTRRHGSTGNRWRGSCRGSGAVTPCLRHGDRRGGARRDRSPRRRHRRP
jgi:hypothetical protein